MYAYRLKSLGSALALAATLAISTAALSQPVPQGADLSQQADDHFLKAKALMKAGNVRGAYEEYKAAWGLKKTYDTATNLGNVELTLGMPRDAAEHLAFALRSYAVTGVTPDKLERMKQVFAQARAQVGAMQVKVSVDDAEVIIDGRSVGRSPIAEELFVEPGSHVIEAKLTGYQPAKTTVTVDKGGSQTATLTLAATAPPPPPTSAVPPPPPGPNKIVLATGSAAAGVGIVLGAVFAGVSSSKASSAATQRDALAKAGTPVRCGVGAQATPACADLADTVDAKRTFANASVWSFVGGGAVGAATLIYWLATPKSTAPAKPDVRVLPAAGPQGAGLELRGTW